MPDVSRRNLLKFLGLTPAIPLISKIPVTEPVPMPQIPAQVPVTNPSVTITGGSFTASGGYCAPQHPLYDFWFASGSRPLSDSLPPAKTQRSGIKWLGGR